ncbi:SDR family oxidoreductase [Mycobacterium sp. NPDC006124]|uniref:SDR family NAD(P)-dependent oxidoreductase n=1 Tax=Mycobacterium sp. NPDC006124 TaxID=3156729 RepID=UPI0033B72C33
MADEPLEGRLALVTGAAQGIGAAVAHRLAADGARVAVNDLAPTPALTEVVEATGGFPAVGDISGPGVTTLVDGIEEDHGPVEILVCNAAYMSMAPFLDDDEDDWWRVIEVNLAGTFRLIQAILPGMRRAGGGNVVVIASEWGVVGWPEASAYSASKAGLIALVKTLGRELARENITVNAIAPGVVDTPQLLVDAESAGTSLDEMHRRYGAAIPMGRIGRAEEIAGTVSLLARRDVGAMVGQTLQINGGSTRCRV